MAHHDEADAREAARARALALDIEALRIAATRRHPSSRIWAVLSQRLTAESTLRDVAHALEHSDSRLQER